MAIWAYALPEGAFGFSGLRALANRLRSLVVDFEGL